MGWTPTIGYRCWCIWETTDGLQIGRGFVPPWEGIVIEAKRNSFRVVPVNDVGMRAAFPESAWPPWREAMVTAERLAPSEAEASDAYLAHLEGAVDWLAESLKEKRAELERWRRLRDAVMPPGGASKPEAQARPKWWVIPVDAPLDEIRAAIRRICSDQLNGNRYPAFAASLVTWFDLDSHPNQDDYRWMATEVAKKSRAGRVEVLLSLLDRAIHRCQENIPAGQETIPRKTLGDMFLYWASQPLDD